MRKWLEGGASRKRPASHAPTPATAAAISRQCREIAELSAPLSLGLAIRFILSVPRLTPNFAILSRLLGEPIATSPVTSLEPVQERHDRPRRTAADRAAAT